VTTIQGPSVPRDDQPTTNARRTQKVNEDILGRALKTETLTWTGSVYSTVKASGRSGRRILCGAGRRCCSVDKGAPPIADCGLRIAD
jgi:D-serine deaminase-like pyridoxal phosphate-dependent protein